MKGREGGAAWSASSAWGWSPESDLAWADLRAAVEVELRTRVDGRQAEMVRVPVSVSAGELAGLLGAWVVARERAGQVLALLVLLGFDAGEVPRLCGSLDEAGAPVVRLGGVDAVVLRRLRMILDGIAA